MSQLPALESFGEPDPQQLTFRELEEGVEPETAVQETGEES